jgi:hypothetical protein
MRAPLHCGQTVVTGRLRHSGCCLPVPSANANTLRVLESNGVNVSDVSSPNGFADSIRIPDRVTHQFQAKAATDSNSKPYPGRLCCF